MSGLVLASASKARADMLRSAGLPVEIDPARIDEDAVKAALRAEGAPPRDQADTLAEMKAIRISGRHSGKLVLGADQILVLENRVYDKPADMPEARSHLIALRGKTHKLMSAAVIAQDGAPLWRHVGIATLTMRPFTDEFLDMYLRQVGDLVLETVGCYHLEGLGSQLFARVQGDYFTVLGLPLLEVLGFLRAHGTLRE